MQRTTESEGPPRGIMSYLLSIVKMFGVQFMPLKIRHERSLVTDNYLWAFFSTEKCSHLQKLSWGKKMHLVTLDSSSTAQITKCLKVIQAWGTKLPGRYKSHSACGSFPENTALLVTHSAEVIREEARMTWLIRGWKNKRNGHLWRQRQNQKSFMPMCFKNLNQRSIITS